MNRLNLQFVVDPEKEKCGKFVLHSLLTVDGQRLTDEECDILHLNELVGSIYGYGFFEIYTCTCGVAGCAGIEEDVEVTQDESSVLWTLPQPLIIPDDGCTNYEIFIFDREQYRQAIQEGIKEARKITAGQSGNTVIGPDKFTVEDLQRITTEKPDRIIDRRSPKERTAVNPANTQFAESIIRIVTSSSKSFHQVHCSCFRNEERTTSFFE